VTVFKPKYLTDGAFTVTALHSLASSATAGWCTDAIDNTSTLAIDYLVSGEFKLHNSNAPTAGKSVKVYAFGAYDDAPTWPSLFGSAYSGSTGAFTVTDDEERDSGLVLLWVSAPCDTSTGAIHSMPPRSVAASFGGILPIRFALWVVQDTGQALHSAGNALYWAPQQVEGV
jgi:hypothetical protein